MTPGLAFAAVRQEDANTLGPYISLMYMEFIRICTGASLEAYVTKILIGNQIAFDIFARCHGHNLLLMFVMHPQL